MRKTALATLALLIGSLAVSTGAASPAQAAEVCHTNRNTVSPDNEVRYSGQYPATLHGVTVRLYTDSGNASAYAAASGLRGGDVIQIDRSDFEVRGPRSDHNWLTSTQVFDRGTVDVCKARSIGGLAQTARIDGAHRAVRVCMWRNSSKSCTNIWYADNDDNAGDLT